MRKALVIVSAVVAVVVVVIAAVLVYAARNLNSIIAEKQGYLLQKVSDALDRKVEVASIKATLGWGLEADLTGVKIQDDPALSDRPFIEAKDAFAKVDLLPLLVRHIHVTEVRLKNPIVRVIRTEQGELNVLTLGKGRGETEEKPSENPPSAAIEGAPITSEHGNISAKPRKARAENLAPIYVKSLVVDKGVIVYEERGTNHQTVSVNEVDLSVRDFSFTRTFDFSLKLAMLSDQQNVGIAGTLGPLAPGGALDVDNTHFAIEAKIGPLDLGRLRAIGSLGKAIPEALSVPDPVTFAASANGTPSMVKFHVESDLTANRIGWADLLNKPASVVFKVRADGSRSGNALEVASSLKLAGLEAKATNVSLKGENLSAHVDTNRFDIGGLTKMSPALDKYDASGECEVHADVHLENKQPRANGTISLTDVSIARSDPRKTLVNNLNGDIKLNGNRAEVGPAKFDIGDGHATATLRVSSLQPLNATYNFSIDKVKPGDLVPDRPDGEYLSTVLATGTVTQSQPLPALPSLTAKVSVAEGNLANAGFKDLTLATAIAGNQADIQSFKVAVFNGNVSGSGTTTLEKVPQFSFDIDANNVDIQPALMVQDPKSAVLFRGNIDTQFQVSGRGTKFDDIKPTLKGSGRAVVRDGKLVGANLIVLALNKTRGIPEIGELIPASLMKRHPELFSSPDTDIDRASLTFTLAGIRISTRDLVVQSEDYGMSAAGWFDMERNLDLSGHALLSRKFSHEIVAEKHNVVYITNQDGQVDIPLRIEGRLPKPNVSPDLATMARYAGSHLIQQTGKDVVDKLFGKKKGKNNPLDQLKGLFH